MKIAVLSMHLSGASIIMFALLIMAPSYCPAQEAVPARVISLAPSITRQIHDLGAQHLLVGVTSYCPVPRGSAVQVVGSPGRINIEKAFSLKPSLVLASTDCNSRADVEALKRLGCQVKVFPGCESLACMCATFRELGDLLGRRSRADEMIGAIQAELKNVRDGIKGFKRLRVFWQLGSNPLVTVSDQTFSGEFIRTAGCDNVFGGAPVHYPRVNAEEVIRRNPEVIVVVGRMGAASDRSFWDRFSHVSAVKNGRVYELSADLVCQPTPAMFLKGYKALVALLHPGVP